MALFLTLLYIVLTYTKPEVFYPVLADFRLLLVLGFAAIIVSFQRLARPGLWRSPQTLLLILFIGSVTISPALHGWAGGSSRAFSIFFPEAVVYFLIAANADSWKKMRLIAITLALTGVFLSLQAVNGYAAELGGLAQLTKREARIENWNYDNTEVVHRLRYVIPEEVALPEGGTGLIARLRSVGNLSDPNDFSQFLIATLPLLWLGWKRRKLLKNSLVMLITALYLYTCYLTHSRGGMLALVVVLMFTFKDKLGVAGSGVMSGLFLALLLALNFGGGRGVGIGDSAGRLDAWSEGIALFKSSPLFGMGFGTFMDYNELTAHNSYVLCFTELGITGYLAWIGAIVTVFMGLNSLLKAAKLSVKAESGKNAEAIDTAGERNEEVSKLIESSYILKWASLVRVSLIAFLFTSWFLSRTYAVTLYLLLGLATAATNLGQESLGFELPSIEVSARTAALTTFASIALVYAFVKVQ